MIDYPPPSEERIINCLKTSYEIEVAALIPLFLGADMNAWTYRAQRKDQKGYFLKLRRGLHSDINTAIVELLHDHGIKQVIAPLKTIHHQPTASIDGFTLIVYPFVEGKDGFCVNLTDHQWLTLGKVVRQIHEVKVPASIQQRIRQETYSPTWRERARLLLANRKAQPTDDKVALNLLRFIQEHQLIIEKLITRAEQLSELAKKQSVPSVLCHGDLHAGNLLLHDESFSIVDWDDPIMAPKERDLMFIGAGIANVWNQSHEEKLFYEGYGKTQVDPLLLTYYRHERIVEDIVDFGQHLLFSTGGADRGKMYQQFVDMFAPNGVVDIAFKTDERLNS